tara:strand:+ start:1989 stop:2498 length:510 start_codon:yes stop_codon:yes gene_type:complete
MIFKIIVAHDLHYGIGNDNSLPWNFPEELKRFSKLTRGEGNNAIIMGKNTWESLPKKPLPKRDNLILSTSLELEINTPKNAYIKTFSDISSLDKFCEEQKYDTVWIIGGSKIYEQYLHHNKVEQIYITKIHKIYDCDTKFPDISSWKVKNTETIVTGQIILEYILYERS